MRKNKKSEMNKILELVKGNVKRKIRIEKKVLKMEKEIKELKNTVKMLKKKIDMLEKSMKKQGINLNRS
jgi:hypothetical protein